MALKANKTLDCSITKGRVYRLQGTDDNLYIIDNMHDDNYWGDWGADFTIPEDYEDYEGSQAHVPTNDAGEQLLSTAETLAQRGKRYGEFKGNADLSCQLRDLIMNHRRRTKRDDMPYVQREAINMICAKLSRIANGDPLYDDNWRDIAGFATLVVEYLNKKD